MTLELVPLVVMAQKKNSTVTIHVHMKLSILILRLELSQSRSTIQKNPMARLSFNHQAIVTVKVKNFQNGHDMSRDELMEEDADVKEANMMY